MSSWQSDLLDHLRRHVPGEVVPYGSAVDPDLLDGWSDLDVAVTAREPFDLEAVLDAELWTVQEAHDGDTQVLRAVLALLRATHPEHAWQGRLLSRDGATALPAAAAAR